MISLVCDLSPAALSVQDRVLSRGAENGPAECFLRRAVRRSVSFDGGKVTGLQEADSTELALRVLRGQRVGLVGGSLPHSERAVVDCVERAEASAASGSVVFTRLAPPIRLPLARELPSLPAPDELVARVCDLDRIVCCCRVGFHWSGRITVIKQVARVLHSEGLDAWSAFVEHRLRLRARCTAQQAPVDRLLDVCAADWPEVTSELVRRIDAEFPESEKQDRPRPGASLIIGPALVAQLCLALVSRKSEGETPRLHHHVSLVDEPSSGRQGCDDEGIPVQSLPVVHAGFWFDDWVTVGVAGRAPSGRGFRRAIDAPPTATPLGLRWVEAGREVPRQAMLISEVAGLSVHPDGALHGTAVEGIIMDEGRPVRRCRGRALRLHPIDVLKQQFGGVTGGFFTAGRHRLPQVVLR